MNNAYQKASGIGLQRSSLERFRIVDPFGQAISKLHVDAVVNTLNHAWKTFESFLNIVMAHVTPVVNTTLVGKAGPPQSQQ
jgi:hypothetical protein